MIDKHAMDEAFEDYYKRLLASKTKSDLLGLRLDSLLYECHRAAYTRGHAAGIQLEQNRVNERRTRREEAEAAVPRVRTFSPPLPRPANESSNEAGTASAVHIPIVIEGEISLDRNRPVGEYLEDRPSDQG